MISPLRRCSSSVLFSCSETTWCLMCIAVIPRMAFSELTGSTFFSHRSHDQPETGTKPTSSSFPQLVVRPVCILLLQVVITEEYHWIMGLRRIPISGESPAELIPVSPAFKTSQLSFLPYTHFHLLAFSTYLFAPWLLCLTSLESIIFSFVTVYVCVRMYVGVCVCAQEAFHFLVFIQEAYLQIYFWWQEDWKEMDI